MSGRVAAAALVALAILLPASSASAGQIVYAHGGELWAMNDDGSDQHQLLGTEEIGGSVAPSSTDPQPVSVQPGGTGVAFVAAPDDTCGVQISNCPALYSLSGSRLTRLTAASSPCGSVTVACASEEEEPAVSADGRVVYERLDVASTFSCFYYCGFSGGYSEALYSRALDGSDSPRAWPVPALDTDPEGLAPDFEGPIAADPADPGTLAYQGNFLYGLPETLYPVDVDATGAGAAAVGQPAFDDGFLAGLAFSGDGSLLADVETGGEKGIWVYPAGQDANAPGASFRWALEDPDNGRGDDLDHVLTGLAFVGSEALVFSADDNLYSLPARCWATAVGSTPQPNCHFPQDARQLTSDGSAAAPNLGPAWTSSTTPIASPAADGGGGGEAGGGGGDADKGSGRHRDGGRHGGAGKHGGVSVSAAALRGLAAGRPRLSFTLGAAAGAKLRRIVVKPPRGVGFAAGRRPLRRGIVLRAAGHAATFTATVPHGALALRLAKPAARVAVAIAPPALRVGPALSAAARDGGAAKPLRFAVAVTDTAGHTAHLKPAVRPR